MSALVPADAGTENRHRVNVGNISYREEPVSAASGVAHTFVIQRPTLRTVQDAEEEQDEV